MHTLIHHSAIAISNERIHSIIKRLSSLEDSLADVTSLAAASNLSPCGRGIPPANEASKPISSLSSNSSTTLAHNKTGYPLCNDEGSLRRTRRLHCTNGALPGDNDLSSLSIEGLEPTSLYPPCLEARSFLLDQLRDNGPSGISRRIVLESALSFVERMPNRESVARGQTPQDPDTRVSVASLLEEPPITVDLLYTMLNGNDYNLPGKCAYIIAHISQTMPRPHKEPISMNTLSVSALSHCRRWPLRFSRKMETNRPCFSTLCVCTVKLIATSHLFHFPLRVYKCKNIYGRKLRGIWIVQ